VCDVDERFRAGANMGKLNHWQGVWRIGKQRPQAVVIVAIYWELSYSALGKFSSRAFRYPVEERKRSVVPQGRGV